MNNQQLILFPYDELDTETRIVVQQENKEFDQNMDEANHRFIQACKNLGRIHGALKYSRPGFVDYIWAKGIPNATAYRMLDVAKMFPNLGNIPDEKFGKSALYLLAAPSTPDEARAEAITRAEAGETITHKTAVEITNGHKPTPAYQPDYQPRPVPQPAPETAEYLATCETCGQVFPGDSCPDCLYLEPEPAQEPEPAPTNGKATGGFFMPDIDRIQARANNEYYTPPVYLEAVKELLGAIDLDPASSEIANVNVSAAKIFTEAEDGLCQNWSGVVWLNPPYGGLAGKFALKLVDEFTAGNVTEAVLLVNSNSTDTNWFQPLWEHVLCFTDHRIDFNAQAGNAGGSTHGSVFIYFGPKEAQFKKLFSRFGAVVKKA